jgi:quinoprotein glucose dehydrogenase
MTMNTGEAGLIGRRLRLLVIAGCVLGASCNSSGPNSGNADWLYNGGPEGNHYSPLAQIDASNVGSLQEAWRFDLEEGGLQAQPLVINGVLYGPTPSGKLVALDAATGEQKWVFEPGLPEGQPIRGLSSHGEGSNLRLMFASRNYLYALNPRTGRPIESFGEGGRIDIQENLRGPADQNGMYITSPGSVYKDVYIFSGRVSESTPSSPGHIRAFDVKTGKLRWTFHTIPHPGEPGAETWPEGAHLTQGGANAWAGSVVDAERGIVYVATGSASDDFYGADRLGDNRFANSLIALDANTGRRLWDFQAVRHDLWDMDFNSAPVLMTVTHNGQKVDAVAATNKLGYVYLFDRVTGKPLFPFDEVAVPASTVPGERAAATQPVPRLPAPLSRTSVSEDDLTTRTPAAAAWARGVFRALNGGGKQFTPLTLGKDTLVLSGFTGGVGWGGMAADPNGFLYANVTDVPGISRIVASSSLLSSGVGETAYQQQCAACHGADRKGVAPDFPPLDTLDGRLTDAQIATILKNGRGRMPSFSSMPEDTMTNLISYLKTGRDAPGSTRAGVSLQGRFAPSQTTYTSNGNRNFVDEDGFPGVKPPWGTLSAINMNTGQYLWRIPFGTTNGYGPEFGGSNTGGAVVTASGLLFIGATADRKLHAYDARTGRLLWEVVLTAPGQATPAVYMVKGRQYVVIAASARRRGGNAPARTPAPARGGGLAGEGAGHSTQPAATTPTSNAYIAFALPR